MEIRSLSFDVVDDGMVMASECVIIRLVVGDGLEVVSLFIVYYRNKFWVLYLVWIELLGRGFKRHLVVDLPVSLVILVFAPVNKRTSTAPGQRVLFKKGGRHRL